MGKKSYAVRKNAAIVSWLLCLIIQAIYPAGAQADYGNDTTLITLSNSTPDIQRDSLTGAALYSIPIEVPAGGVGLDPKVVLSYNSNNKKNGIVGVGWSLNMESIQRSTKRGLDYLGKNFIDQNGMDLVPRWTYDQTSESAGNIYGKKIESDYAQYRYFMNQTESRWEVSYQNGVKKTYGGWDSSRQSKCLITIDKDRGIYFKNAFAWFLDSVVDSFGNEIKYTYFEDSNTNQIYLEKITYGGDDSFEIQFQYEDKLHPNYLNNPSDKHHEINDPLYFDYTTHYKVITKKRLKSITINHSNDRLKRYELSYDYAISDATMAIGAYTQSRLSGVAVSGKTDTVVLPPYKFKYHDDTPNHWQRLGCSMSDPPENWLTSCPSMSFPANSTIRIADIDGDKKSDIIILNPDKKTVYTHLSSNLNTRITYVLPTWFKPWWPIMVGDVNGDGKAELVSVHEVDSTHKYIYSFKINSSSSGYIISAQGANIVYQKFCSTTNNVTTCKYDSPFTVTLADMNGDGMDDLVAIVDWNDDYAGIETLCIYRYYGQPSGVFNNTNSGWGYSYIRHIIAESFNPSFVDINNDGGADMIVNSGTGFRVYLNASGNRPIINYGTSTPQGFNFADVNGDGLNDILVQYKTNTNPKKLKTIAYISKGNGDFDSETIDMGEIAETGEHLVVADFDGVGKARSIISKDKMYLADFRGYGRLDKLVHTGTNVVSITYRDALPDTGKNPSPPADYLETIYQGLGDVASKQGKTVSYAYKPSSSYYLNVNCYMPFVSYVVSSATTHDGFNSVTTDYSYAYGLYDAKNRGFKGFGIITESLKNGSDSFFAKKMTYYFKDNVLNNWTNPTEPEDSYYFKGRPWLVYNLIPADYVFERTDYIWTKESSDKNRNYDESKLVTLTEKKTKYDNDNSSFLNETYTYYNYNSKNINNTDITVNGKPGAVKTMTVTGTFLKPRTTTYEYTHYDAGCGVWQVSSEILTEAINGTTNVKVREKIEDWNVVNNKFENKMTCQKNYDKNSVLQYSPVTIQRFDEYGHVVEYGTKSTVISNGSYVSDFSMPEVITKINYGLTSLYPISEEKPDTKSADGKVTDHKKTIFEDYCFINGKPKKVTDEENNKTIYYTFDDFGRQTEVNYPDGGGTGNIYDDLTFPKKITSWSKENSVNQTTNILYLDGYDRKIQSVIPLPSNKGTRSVTLFTYDNLGRVKYTYGPYSKTTYDFQRTDYTNLISNALTTSMAVYYTKTSYDLGYRTRPLLIQTIGNVTHYNYSSPNKVTIVDGDGVTRTEYRDALGRIISITESCASQKEDGTCNGDQHTFYEYNAAGDLTSIKRQDPNHPENTIENKMIYNTLGQKVEMIDPDLGHYTYEYDIHGNLKRQNKLVAGVASEWQIMQYDELNRITSKAYYHADPKPVNFDANNPTVTWTYDDTTITPYNGSGRLSKISNGNVEYKVTGYDEVGRIWSEEKTIKGFDANSSKKEIFSYAYTDSGAIDTITYPGGYTVNYDYYPGSTLLKSVTGQNTKLADITEYTPSGKITKIKYGNMVPTNYSYNYYDRLETLQTLNIVGAGGSLQNFVYYYSLTGDLTNINDYTAGSGLVERTFTYDKMHRLASESSNTLTSNQDPTDYWYSYDGSSKGIHNVKSITSGLNGANTNYTFGYDDNGNMTSSPDIRPTGNKGTRTITYNADNMPLSVRAGNSDTLFRYDGIGKRSAKRVGAGTDTFYFNDLYEIINGVKTRYVFAGNLRIARITGEATVDDIAFIHQDHLGSTTVMTDIDGERVNYDAIRYTPFGLETNGQTQLVSLNYRFTDQEKDGSTGLYNYDARLYDPAIGLFVTGDTIVPNMYDPQSLNRYAYCRNSPLIYVDPTGHNTIFLGGAGNARDTAIYANSIVHKMERIGIPYPIYIPLSNPGGKIINVLVTLANTHLPNDSLVTNMITNKIINNSNDIGGQRNLIGYSYGSTMAAQAALKMANSGIYIDNLILIGSPIPSWSSTLNLLSENKNIGNITRIDIPNDPFSNGVGIHLENFDNHFYFSTNEHNQQDQLAMAINDILNPTNGFCPDLFRYENYFDINNTPDNVLDFSIPFDPQ